MDPAAKERGKNFCMELAETEKRVFRKLEGPDLDQLRMSSSKACLILANLLASESRLCWLPDLKRPPSPPMYVVGLFS
jgi:hypothetical protein